VLAGIAKREETRVSAQQIMTPGPRSARIHLAQPTGRAAAGVVVVHPWWGLNADVIDFTDRLAGAGFAAAAPDLFDGVVATTIEDADQLSNEVNEDAADATVLGTVDELGAAIGDPGARIGVVGFSFGAAWALWLPAQRRDVTATVLYYGSSEGPSLARARTPVLGHFADSDPYETPENVAALERTLRFAGREVEIHRYAGTGHWFAEPSQDAYAPPAAELAFDRTVDFLRRHLVDDR
jgi:carboxymethylenebutenolidase